MQPLKVVVLACLAGAVSGLLGGVGGRKIVLRLALGEVWDSLDQLSRRLSKREGAVGNRVAKDNALQRGPEVASFLARLRGAQPPQRLDEAEMTRRAHEHFKPKPKDADGGSDRAIAGSDH